MSHRYNNLRIIEGGKLLADEWNYDNEKQQGHVEAGTDITDKAMYYMNEECELEDGLKFKDIMLLIKNIDKYDSLSPLFTGGLWLKDLIDDGLSENNDFEKPIDTMYVYRAASLNDDDYNTNNDYLTSYVSVDGKLNNDDITYALDFIPLYELSDAYIVLNKEFLLIDERQKSNENWKKYLNSLSDEERKKETLYPKILETKKDFSLFDILHGIFWELSFHGGPKNKKDRANELKEIIKNIDNKKDLEE